MKNTTEAAPAASAPYDSFLLCHIVRELADRIVDGQIQDIRQPTADELQLRIHTTTGNHLLQMSIDARNARMHLTSERSANAPTPYSFCSALRRCILGGRVLSVSQLGFDRVATLVIRNNDPSASAEPAHHAEFTLYVELMGKHSNLVLVDERGKIVDSARRISHRLNRFRETLPGLKYVFPPNLASLPQVNALEMAEEIFKGRSDSLTLPDFLEAIKTAAPAISPFLAREIVLQASCEAAETDFRLWVPDPPLDRVEHFAKIWSYLFHTPAPGRTAISIRNCSGAGAYAVPLLQFPAAQQSPIADLNAAVDRGFREAIFSLTRLESTRRLEAELCAERDQLLKLVKSMERSISESDRAAEYTRTGELLLANLWKLTGGESKAEIVDYYDVNQAERIVTLNPRLSPNENADAYFDKARRARESKANAQERLDALRPRLDRISTALDALHALAARPETGAAEILAMREELIRTGNIREARATTAQEAPDYQGHKVRRYRTQEGFEILLGETATANDYLTTRVAAPNDLWLHVRSATSAHVVVRTHGRPADVPSAVLLRAAMLCALHSSQKHSSLVAVDYTLKKHVRKPRGAAPGSVSIQQEKTLHVSPADDRESTLTN